MCLLFLPLRRSLIGFPGCVPHWPPPRLCSASTASRSTCFSPTATKAGASSFGWRWTFSPTFEDFTCSRAFLFGFDRERRGHGVGVHTSVFMFSCTRFTFFSFEYRKFMLPFLFRDQSRLNTSALKYQPFYFLLVLIVCSRQLSRGLHWHCMHREPKARVAVRKSRARLYGLRNPTKPRITVFNKCIFARSSAVLFVVHACQKPEIVSHRKGPFSSVESITFLSDAS